MPSIRPLLHAAALGTTLCMLAACGSPDKPPPQAQASTSGGEVGMPAHNPPPGYKVGKPYQINGVWYYPRIDWTYSETGIASWYGDPFHGRRTANGEVYDQDSLTAAHKTLPLGATVRVTNLENGRQLTMRLNDRGPFVNGRIIDVSRRGAQLLDFQRQGVAKVRVDVIAPGQPGGGALPRPETPPSERTAVAAAPTRPVTSEALGPPSGGPAARPAPARPVPAPQTVPMTPPAAPVLVQGPVRPSQIYVQAGAFASYQNAYRLNARLAPLGKATVSETRVEGMTFFRVRLGPLRGVDEADRVLDQVIAMGETKARIVVD